MLLIESLQQQCDEMACKILRLIRRSGQQQSVSRVCTKRCGGKEGESKRLPVVMAGTM